MQLQTNEEVIQPVSGQQILFNMESLVKNHASKVDDLKHESKKVREMIEDILLNDPNYQKQLETAKEANKIKNATKAVLLKQPQAAELSSKLKELNSDAKETKEALSDYLQEYARLANVNEVELDDGEVREIVYSARLVKKAFTL